MWYVIQTFGGEEENTADMIRKQVSPCSIKECFVPKRERLKKFHGYWNKMEEVLFCGYVFVISDRPEELYQELKRIPKLTKVLGREENYFWALDEKEKKFVQQIGDRQHKTSISKVAVREGKDIQVIDGPLKDYMDNVVKVNLHRREVIIEMEMMRRTIEVYMGIDIVDGNMDC